MLYTISAFIAPHSQRDQSILALYKGATPPAVGWAAIDSLLLGSLHNYRLFLIRHKFTEPVPGSDTRRLTLVGHGIAGLGAGLTRLARLLFVVYQVS